MKATIVTCYESNEERVSFVYDAMKKRDYEINVITSDFSHIRKEKRNSVPEGFFALNADPYQSNLSLARIRSHQKFARDAFELIGKQDPDLIWCVAPANSLIKEANTYKKNHMDVKFLQIRMTLEQAEIKEYYYVKILKLV